jgi:hypothetical protein
MLQLTQRAREALLETLEEYLDVPDGDPDTRLAFRVLSVSAVHLREAAPGPEPDPGGASMALDLGLDEPDGEDELVRCGDRPLLIVAEPLATLLDGVKVDVIDASDGSSHLAVEVPGGLN